MQLAKPCLDVGMYTDRLAVVDFWRDEVGLTLDHVLRVRRGHDQHRFDLNGSVLKVNVVADGLPESAGRSTITDVVVADPARAGTTVTDPDGTTMRFVAPGTGGVEQIGVGFAVADLARTMRHYTHALGWEAVGPAGVRCARTVLWFEERAGLQPVPALPLRGWAYLTVQIHDCDAEHRGFLERGGIAGTDPVTLGETARICMVRDPDGNWLEFSQRASLTGPLPTATS